MVLHPIHQKYGIERAIVSTYQSITGTGVKAVQQLENEYQGVKGEMAYPYPIHKNAIPHCDVFLENDYTKEEMKLTNETKKILGDNQVQVVATAVRIPVVGGHSESVHLELKSNFDIKDIKKILSEFPGVIIQDQVEVNQYPMPIYAEGKDEVFVGRIRRDFTRENALNLWIVADNLRKGAATNTVQIAEYLVANKLV
jgi:aspartate-semialdehyde dehydrogenase